MTSHKLPSHLMVLGERFRVELVPNLHSGEDKVHGETVGDYRRIRICADLDIRRQFQTLLHEFVHATLHVMGASNYLDDNIEESIAQSLEYAMSQLLRQHGSVLADLFNNEQEE